MEINITKFFQQASARDYSASMMELGRDAAKITWNHALEDSAEEYVFLTTKEQVLAFHAYLQSTGFEPESIAGLSKEDTKKALIELRALFLQTIAAEIRASDLDTSNPDWLEYYEDCVQGRCSGNLFCADDGEIYFTFA